MSYFVYILASQKNGTLYVGMTNDLAGRVISHRDGVGSKFTAQHRVARLVWYDVFENVWDAITVEKRLKRWRRAWKIRLIEDMNPDWMDLFPDLLK